MPTITGVIFTLFKFQSALISPDRFVNARIFGDVYCRYCSHLGQRQIGCFVDFIHRNYVTFVADHLMVSLDREIPQNFY